MKKKKTTTKKTTKKRLSLVSFLAFPAVSLAKAAAKTSTKTRIEEENDG
jgi:hypothetical protein